MCQTEISQLNSMCSVLVLCVLPVLPVFVLPFGELFAGMFPAGLNRFFDGEGTLGLLV